MMIVSEARRSINKAKAILAFIQTSKDCGRYIKISKSTAKSLLVGKRRDDHVNFLWSTAAVNTLVID